jgi:hypothetical protein
MRTAAALVVALLAAGAHGQTRQLAGDLGGDVMRYREVFQHQIMAGDDFVVSGLCASACTQILTFRNIRRICATADGVFAFHSASVGGAYSRDGTAFMWLDLTERAKAAVLARGWDGTSEHPAPIFVPAVEIVGKCKQEKEE